LELDDESKEQLQRIDHCFDIILTIEIQNRQKEGGEGYNINITTVLLNKIRITKRIYSKSKITKLLTFFISKIYYKGVEGVFNPLQKEQQSQTL
jgi:hypothetical protein